MKYIYISNNSLELIVKMFSGTIFPTIYPAPVVDEENNEEVIDRQLFGNISAFNMEQDSTRLSTSSSSTQIYITSTDSDVYALIQDMGGAVLAVETSILDETAQKMWDGVMGSSYKDDSSADEMDQEEVEENLKSEEQQHEEAANFEVVENLCEFVCQMCNLICLPKEGIVLFRCLHSFCRNCLKQKIYYSNTSEIKCYFLKDGGMCESSLLEQEIKEVLDADEYIEYSRAKILEVENALFCNTEGCMGWCILEDGLQRFHCQVCNKINCLTCATVSDNGECVTCAARIRAKEEAEKKLNYSALYQLYQDDTVLNLAPFECPICFTNCEIGEGITLKGCLHSFCKPCLVKAVQFTEHPDVHCPYGDAESQCENVMTQREVQAIVPKALFEKHLERSLKTFEVQLGAESIHCKNPDCRGWGILDAGIVNFYCPVCGQDNCVKCEAIHPGVTCEAYTMTKTLQENDRQTAAVLQEMVSNATYMPCPKCRILLTKTEGCDGMTCTVCKTQICWATRGPRWGPGGQGDTSGGCRCNFNGRKCHVNCTNCH